MQQQHTQVGRDGIKPARVHDARARARGHAVIAVDGLPHEQHFSGQVRIIGARAGAGLNKRQPSAAIRPHRGRHDPGCAGKRRQRRRISGICHQQRPRGGSTPKTCPDIRKPLLGPASEPDADAGGRVISQIACHQLPGETGGAEHHNIQLTVAAHPIHAKDTSPDGAAGLRNLPEQPISMAISRGAAPPPANSIRTPHVLTMRVEVRRQERGEGMSASPWLD